MTSRRRLLALGLAPLSLAGCGFELRRAPELRQNINASKTTQVVEATSQAQVVLEATVDTREKSVVASTAAGQVRELQLRTRLEFRLRTLSGRELIPKTEILLSRDMNYTEDTALAKEQEETFLYRAMQSDIVGQVMRRLAAVPAI